MQHCAKGIEENINSNSNEIYKCLRKYDPPCLVSGVRSGTLLHVSLLTVPVSGWDRTTAAFSCSKIRLNGYNSS